MTDRTRLVAYLRDCSAGCHCAGCALRKRAADAIEELERDAMRYRWIRSNQGRGKLFTVPRVCIEFGGDAPKGGHRTVQQPMDDMLDAAIDAALAATHADEAKGESHG